MTKRIICLMLCITMVLTTLAGCRAQTAETVPQTTAVETTAAATEAPTEPSTEVPTEAPTETTVPTQPAEPLALDAEEVIFAHTGEEAAIYSGNIDPDLIDWTSDDVSVALFYQGRVIAVGAGETTVHAEYMGQKLSCHVISNAPAEEARPILTPDIWQAPQRKAPRVEEDLSEFFNDAIFMGDSTTYSLYLWNLKSQELGKPLFLVRGGVSIFSLIEGLRKYLHDGEEKMAVDAVADAVRNEGRTRLFIMLGANDLAMFGVEGTVEKMDTFLTSILEKSPDLEIYLESITPVRTPGLSSPDPDNALFDEYNAALEAYAQEKGYHYVPIAPYFKDNLNALVTEYSYDRMHADDEGCWVWSQVLKQYALDKGE